MPYTPPGISVEQVLIAAAPAPRAASQIAAVAGEVYQVVKRGEISELYTGTMITPSYPGLIEGAVVDTDVYPPVAYAVLDGEEYDITSARFTTTPVPTVGSSGAGMATIASITVNRDGAITAVVWASSAGHMAGDVLTFSQGVVSGTYMVRDSDLTGGSLRPLSGIVVRGSSRVTYDRDSIDLPANLALDVLGTDTAGLAHGTLTTDGLLTAGAGQNFIASGVRPGDIVRLGTTDYDIEEVISATQLQVEENDRPAEQVAANPMNADPAMGLWIRRSFDGASILVSYRAARTDAQVIGQYLEAENTDDLVDLFGRDGYGTEENPLGFGMALALGASGTRVAGVGVDATVTGVSSWQQASEVMANNLVYATAPLTMSSTLQDYYIAAAKKQSQPAQKRERIVYVAREWLDAQVLAESGATVMGEVDLTPNFQGAPAAVPVVETVTGNGSGGVISAITVNSSGQITDITWATAGTGYGVGDIIRITQGAATAEYTLVSGDVSSGALATMGSLTLGGTQDGTFFQTSGDFFGAANTRGIGQGDILVFADGTRIRITGPPTGERLLPITQSGAINAQTFTIERPLSKARQSRNIAAIARGLLSQRVIAVGPDEVVLEVAGEDRTLPGFYWAAIKAGMRAGAPIGQPLINATVPFLTSVVKGSNYFSQEQLNTIAGAGWQLAVQENIGAPVYIRDELTTDQSQGARAGQEAPVAARDFAARLFRDTLRPQVGRRNLTPRQLELIRLTAQKVSIELLELQESPFGTMDVLTVEESETEEGKVVIEVDTDQNVPYTGGRLRLLVN